MPRLGENGCISCREAETNGSVVFCQICYNGLLSMTPMIVEVPRDHERYKSGQSIVESQRTEWGGLTDALVESQFRQKWLHNGRCPEVHAIYKIVSTKANVARYERYLSVSLIITSTFTLMTHVVTGIASKRKETLPPRARRAEMRTEDGTERQGSATSETTG